MPEAPFNLLATEWDKVIDLIWTAPSSQRKISKYNIYIWESSYDLKLATESVSTSTRITNLENGKKYYMTVSAIDEENIEWPQSGAISSTPNIEIIEPVHPVAPPVVPKSKPLRAIAWDSLVTLSWDEGPRASQYESMFWVAPHQYEVEIKTKNNALSYVVEDLINDVPYFFTVQAIDENWFAISEQYSYVKSTPNWYWFKIIPSNKYMPQYIVPKTDNIKWQTWPETVLFILISLIVTIGVFIIKKWWNNREIINVINTQSVRKLQF